MIALGGAAIGPPARALKSQRRGSGALKVSLAAAPGLRLRRGLQSEPMESINEAVFLAPSRSEDDHAAIVAHAESG